MDEWKVSLHGGHSGDFCEHASGTLREILEAAVRFGYHTFGVSEHVSRVEERFLYPEEIAKGWTVERVDSDFERYEEAITPLAHEFADRLTVLRGFECEVVPSENYIGRMKAIRDRRLPDGTSAFDYCVGSVHYVDEFQVDGSPASLAETVAAFGSLETVAVRYYETVAAMVEAVRPDVVGHLDLIKKNVIRGGMDVTEITTERVQIAARAALEAVREHGAILDLNTAGRRKGLGEPYPAPWLVRQAQSMGIGFCFGDDSHRPSEVGAGLADARTYLLENGVTHITALTREGEIGAGNISQCRISLE